MLKRNPVFTVDWETWFNAVEPHWKWRSLEPRIEENTYFILELLNKYEVKAIFYVLGWLRKRYSHVYDIIVREGHTIGYHGYWHKRWEYECGNPLFRSPYWSHNKMPGWSGGVFLRVLPLSMLVRNINKSGVLWLHPHDVDEGHPRLKHPILNIKRRLGLKGIRAKLDKLMEQIEFCNPEEYLQQDYVSKFC